MIPLFTSILKKIQTCELIPDEDVLYEPVRVGPGAVVHQPEGGDDANVAGPEGEMDHTAWNLKRNDFKKLQHN